MKHSKQQEKKYFKEYEHFERAMSRREGFKAIKAKVIVLPKPDFNFKLKLVSNDGL